MGWRTHTFGSILIFARTVGLACVVGLHSVLGELSDAGKFLRQTVFVAEATTGARSILLLMGLYKRRLLNMLRIQLH